MFSKGEKLLILIRGLLQIQLILIRHILLDRVFNNFIPRTIVCESSLPHNCENWGWGMKRPTQITECKGRSRI
jgi:hypothetical protein